MIREIDGEDYSHVIIIDDYYIDPDEVRDFALNSEFSKPVTAKWNGLHSLNNHSNTKATYHDIASRVSPMGKTDWEDVVISEKFWGRAGTGFFGLLQEGETDTIHFHYRTGRWSGICYLTPNELIADGSGTQFYRHVKSNRLSANETSADEIKLLRSEMQNEALFVENYFVEMKFNRMVIFDGRYFHKATNGFGDEIGNSRLTQLFSLNFL